MRRGRIRPHSRLGYARSAGLNGHAGARSCCEHRVVRKVKIRKDSRDLTNLSRHRQGTPRWRVCRNAGAVRSRCQRGPRGRHRGERGPPSAARRNGRGAQAFEKATTCAQMSSPVIVGEEGVEPSPGFARGDFKSPASAVPPLAPFHCNRLSWQMVGPRNLAGCGSAAAVLQGDSAEASGHRRLPARSVRMERCPSLPQSN